MFECGLPSHLPGCQYAHMIHLGNFPYIILLIESF